MLLLLPLGVRAVRAVWKTGLWKIPPDVPQGRGGVWGRRQAGQALRLHTGEAYGLLATGPPVRPSGRLVQLSGGPHLLVQEPHGN